MSAPMVRYVPGTAVAVVHEGVAVLLAADGEDPLVVRVAALVQGGGGVDDVLDALASGGLKGLIDFGAVEVLADGIRVVVRGVVHGRVGTSSARNLEHTMWHDSWQPGATEAELSLVADPAGPSLPITSAVVFASALTISGATRPPQSASAAPSVIDSDAAPAQAPATFVPGGTEFVTPVAEAFASSAAEAIARPPDVPSTTSAADGFASLFGVTQLPPSLDAADPGEPDLPSAMEQEATTLEHRGGDLDASATMVAPLTTPVEHLPRLEPEPPPPPPPPTGLITSVPWMAEPVPDPAAAQTPAPVEPSTDDSRGKSTELISDNDSQNGGRVGSAPIEARSTDLPVTSPLADRATVPAPVVAPASVVPASTPVATSRPAPLPPATEPLADAGSDRTVNRSALIGLPPVVMVVSARCAQGHVSPAYAGACRVCGAPIPPQQPVEIPRPTLGQLRLSTGGVVPLDRPAILGRNPRIPPGYASEQPNLVRLPDPEKDVSGQHLEVSLDYWNVVVRDLGSTNGTEVILPGEMPVALRANDPVIIEPGTRVVLAGTISFTFEVVA